MALRIAALFPDLCNGLYVELVAIARKSNGPIPGWFADWLSREHEATSIRIWQPIIVPGLFQTADYARALPVPPHLWAVLDESVLHRLVGTPKTMHDQLVHLAAVSQRPYISIQVVPASTGAHAGLACAFLVGSSDGEPDLLLIEAVEDQTVKDQEVVRKAAVAFDLVRGDALTRDASRDLILKVAEDK